jgi:hypothetical protein
MCFARLHSLYDQTTKGAKSKLTAVSSAVVNSLARRGVAVYRAYAPQFVQNRVDRVIDRGKKIYEKITVDNGIAVYEAWAPAALQDRVTWLIGHARRLPETTTVVKKTIVAATLIGIVPLMLYATAGSFIFSGLVAAANFVNPALLATAGFVIPPFMISLTYYGLFGLKALESVRQIYLFCNLYHLELSKALERDVENLITADLAKMLKSKYPELLEKVWGTFEIREKFEALNIEFENICYYTIANLMAKAILTVMSDSELQRQIYSGDVDKMEMLERAIGSAFIKLVLDSNRVSREILDALMFSVSRKEFSSQDEPKLYGCFRSIAETVADKMKVSYLQMSGFAKDAWFQIRTSPESLAGDFLSYFPSRHFHDQDKTVIKGKSDKFWMKVSGLFYVLVNLRTKLMFQGVPVVGPLLGKILEAYFAGCVLMSQKLITTGMSPRQIYDVLKNNKTECLKLGLMLTLPVDIIAGGIPIPGVGMLPNLLSFLPGGNHTVVQLLGADAVYHPFFQVFCLAMMLRSDPFPGEPGGTDLLWYNRKEAELGATKLAQNGWRPLVDQEKRQRFFEMINHPIIRFLRSVLAGKKLKTTDALVQIDAVNRGLKLYGQDILEAIQGAEQDRRIAAFFFMLSLYEPALITQKEKAIQIIQRMIEKAEEHRLGLPLHKVSAKERMTDWVELDALRSGSVLEVKAGEQAKETKAQPKSEAAKTVVKAEAPDKPAVTSLALTTPKQSQAQALHTSAQVGQALARAAAEPGTVKTSAGAVLSEAKRPGVSNVVTKPPVVKEQKAVVMDDEFEDALEGVDLGEYVPETRTTAQLIHRGTLRLMGRVQTAAERVGDVASDAHDLATAVLGAAELRARKALS